MSFLPLVMWTRSLYFLLMLTPLYSLYLYGMNVLLFQNKRVLLSVEVWGGSIKLLDFQLAFYKDFTFIGLKCTGSVKYLFSFGKSFKRKKYCALKRQLSLACRRNIYPWRHSTNKSPTVSNRSWEVVKRNQRSLKKGTKHQV